MRYHCHFKCGYVSGRQFDLDRHVKTDHLLRLNKYDCPARGCDRRGEQNFKRMDHLKEHLRKVHAKPPNDIPTTYQER